MTQAGGSNEAGAQGTSSTTAVRLLTATVVVMGIMIFAGLAVVVGRIIYLATAASRQAPAPAGSVHVIPVEARQMQLGLPAGAAVRTISLSGNRLAVHYDAPTGSGIVLVDTATGAVVSRLRIDIEAQGQTGR